MTRPTFTAAELARQLDATLQGRGDVVIAGVNTPDEAGPGDLTFLGSAVYARCWAQSRAAAAVVTDAVRTALAPAEDARPLLVVTDADHAMARALELFQAPEVLPDEGVHPTAWIDSRARLGSRVRIGPHVSVDRDAEIGDDVVLQAGVRIHAGVIIGANSILHANVVVRQGCRIGCRAILHQNVSLGADGFGYRPAPDGRGLVKMPHIGGVVLGDDVELGANTCVDRGKFGATTIGAGTKIDNLCQIAHNIRIGRSCVIAACAAIGGSVVIGDGVQIGGAVSIRDHLTIGDGARIAGGSILYHDVPAGAVWAGFPAGEATATKRQWVMLRRLPELMRLLRKSD